MEYYGQKATLSPFYHPKKEKSSRLITNKEVVDK